MEGWTEAATMPPSLHQNPRSTTTFVVVGLALIGFVWFLGQRIVNQALERSGRDEAALSATVGLVVALKEQSSILTGAGGDLQAKLAAFAAALAELQDEAARRDLQKSFAAVEESAGRLGKLVDGLFAPSRFSLGAADPPRGPGPGASFAAVEAIPAGALPALIGTAVAAQPPKPAQVRPDDLRRMYEETMQRRDKIALIENTFYVLAGLGAVLLLTIFVPGPTRKIMAETANTYLPALLSSWGTFLAAIAL